MDRHDATSLEEWISILHVSANLGVVSGRRLAIIHLSTLASPIDKIDLGLKYHIVEWLPEAYHAVCMQSQPLNDEEARRLGVDQVMKIWAASVRIKCLGMEPRHHAARLSVIADIFGLTHSPSVVQPCESDLARGPRELIWMFKRALDHFTLPRGMSIQTNSPSTDGNDTARRLFLFCACIVLCIIAIFLYAFWPVDLPPREVVIQAFFDLVCYFSSVGQDPNARPIWSMCVNRSSLSPS